MSSVNSDILEIYRRVQALEANPPPVTPLLPIAYAVAIWNHTFVSTDGYMSGVPDDIPVFATTVGGDGEITDAGDSLNLTLTPGVYLARMNAFLPQGVDPSTFAFDLQFGFTGSVFGMDGGSPFGIFEGTLGPTFSAKFPPTTSNTAPFVYIARSELMFIVPSGTVNLKSQLKTDTAGVTFRWNLSGTTNPGASNLTIIRVGP